LTCEAVLAEAIHHTQDARPVLDMLNEGVLKVGFNVEEHTGRLEELAERYSDRSPDLADLCVIRMSELFLQRTVLTVDATDFRVYRRNRTEKIPFIAPRP
jgi:uncharacterized protein